MSEYEELYEEIKFKNNIQVEGLDFPLDIFIDEDNYGIGTKYSESINAMFSQDKESHKGVQFPACFITPKGHYQVRIRWNRTSRYKLIHENGRFDIIDKDSEKVIYEDLKFRRRADYYKDKTSDGTQMRYVAQDNGLGVIFICYSNECSLKDKGEDCLFCNINATKATYGEDIAWKTPAQIGETVKRAYADGYNHLTVSGGFIPERREVEYYLDVAETISDYLDGETFHGTVCVGAPEDFSVFEKYKEAGFSSIATNMEVWNANLFDYYCPGKSKHSGGHDRWLAALKKEVDVFGRYNVRSTFVAGLETKDSLLEGISYLAENGVIGNPSQWYVNVGSQLEGHRTPQPEWHWEVQERTAEIYINNGISWDQFRNATADPDTVAHDLFRLKQGIVLRADGSVVGEDTEKKIEVA